jgi:Zn-dependent protease
MNPAAHVDWIGTILFPAIAIGSGLPLLGWAKPVPTNPRKYRNYVRGDILVSIAGVCMNAILAVGFALLLWIMAVATRHMAALPETVSIIARMATYGVLGNIGLIVFNLLPIPPLDGSHVFYHLLPARWGAEYRKLYPFGFLILWGLVLTGVLRVLVPLIYIPARLLLSPALNTNAALFAPL